ncbi:hypothetical protein, partial [Mycobacterium sp. HOS05]|uniref:hypothetical protein n=1 Tax=Mycobacterium sp. HOS05 TaxID=3071119 RepID=UPI0036DD0B2B
ILGGYRSELTSPLAFLQRPADPWLAPIFARSTLRHSHHLGGIAQTGAVADQQGQIAGLGRAGRQ